MLSKTIIAALLATAAVALPANTGMSILSLSVNRLKAITDSLIQLATPLIDVTLT
jgi:hypothetical protein